MSTVEGKTRTFLQFFDLLIIQAYNAWGDILDVAVDCSGVPLDINLLQVDLNEEWAGESKWRDYLWLTNKSEIDLRDILLLVELKNIDSKTTYHIHYVPEWKNNADILTVYHAGYDYALTQTFPDIDKIRIWLYSPLLRTKSAISYQYRGSERDKYLKVKLANVSVSDVSYQPYDKGIFFDDYRGLSLRLKGWSPPKHEIYITFHSSTWGTKTLYWENDEWDDNDKRTFSSKMWGWDPDSIEAELHFPDSNYVHKLGHWNR